MEKKPLDADIHAVYRREVCYFLSSCDGNSSILKAAEANVGSRALRNDSYPVTSAPPSNLDHRLPATVVHCHGCGACLRNAKMRINSVNRGKTRRRRKSRQLSRKKRNNINIHTQELFASVTSGSCRSAVIQECNNCGVTRKMQGMPPKKSKGGLAEKDEQRHRAGAKRKLAAMRKGGNDAAKAEGKNNPGDDFVPLAAKKSNSGEASTRCRATAKRNPDTARSGNVPGRRPRKKKKNNGSQLMNFLSSLND